MQNLNLGRDDRFPPTIPITSADRWDMPDRRFDKLQPRWLAYVGVLCMAFGAGLILGLASVMANLHRLWR